MRTTRLEGMEKHGVVGVKAGQLRCTTDVADQLAVSASTVHRLAAAGVLRKLHIGRSGRFLEADVASLIERASSEAGAR
jgi:excisionase family DNA binding protein